MPRFPTNASQGLESRLPVPCGTHSKRERLFPWWTKGLLSFLLKEAVAHTHRTALLSELVINTKVLLSDQESKPCGLYSCLLSTALQLAAVAVSWTLVVLKHKITKLNLACMRSKWLRLTLKAKAHTGAQGAHF